MPKDASWRKCCICGRFISNADFEGGKVGWHDPTSWTDMEPREEMPFHKKCDGYDPGDEMVS